MSTINAEGNQQLQDHADEVESDFDDDFDLSSYREQRLQQLKRELVI